MTDPKADEQRPQDEAAPAAAERHEPVDGAGDGEAVEPMPRWLPILIGAILVAFAALAVYTGLRYREGTLTSHIGAAKQTGGRVSNAPPGEPDAGSSFVLQGETPAANEAVPGQSRTIVTGGRGGVQTVTRVHARRGMTLNVTPPDALVYVNSLPVGEARQFNSSDEAYEFPEHGSYTVRLVAPSGVERTFLVTTADDAYSDLASIEADLSLKKP